MPAVKLVTEAVKRLSGVPATPAMESFKAAAEVPYRNQRCERAAPPVESVLPWNVAPDAVMLEMLSVSIVGATGTTNCRVSPDDVPFAFFANAAMYQVPAGVNAEIDAVNRLSGDPTVPPMLSARAVRVVP